MRRTKIINKPIVAKIWLNIAILDLVIYYSYIWFKSYFGSFIICDRFVDDTRLDFILNFPKIDFECFLTWKLLVLIRPKPDYYFLLMVSPKVSLIRGLEKNEPFPDSNITLKKRFNMYTNMYTSLPNNYIYLDCSQSINTILF